MIRTTASARRRSSGRTSARASPCTSSRSRTSTPRGGTSRPRSCARVDEGTSLSEIAVVYRTNAQSRVLEDILVRQGVDYQVIGGPRFYERAEIKDAIAYLQVLDNPTDAVSLSRIANRPRRGVGDTSLARLQTFADGIGVSLWDALGRAEEVGLAAASLRAVQSLRSLLQSLMSVAQEVPVAELVERVLERSGYLEALEAERTIEARGRIENLEELVGVAREYQVNAHGRGEEPTLSQFLQEISLHSQQDDLRRRERRPGDADDAAQREGPRVPRRLHARDGGRDLPAHALDRGERHRGGAAALLRRHDARQGAADDDARDAPLALRAHGHEPAVALPRRAARGRRRARAAAAGVVVELRRAARRASSCRRSSSELPSLSTGDAVRHHTLGTGIVTRIEPDGVVTVRFEDGTERRLMLEYAPLEKVAG